MTELNFKGKEFVYNHHLAVPFRPLIPHAEKGIGPVSLDGNLIIHGDNLHALKALLPIYAGKVDCIFIDPPYNTGNEGWCYNDNVNAPMIKEWLASNPIGIEDGLRHDKWCAMMWPRLRLLHELLAEDGTFWITLDDNEAARGKLLLDEIFGEKNFISSAIWQKKYSTKSDTNFLSPEHDFIFAYAKNIEIAEFDGLERTEEQDSLYKNPDNDPRGVWTSDNLLRTEARDYAIFEIVGPNGETYLPPKGSSWRFNREKIDDLRRDNRIWFGVDGKSRPRLKRFLEDVRNTVPAQTIWKYAEVGHSDSAKKALQLIFQDIDVAFATPKPIQLIQRILRLIGKPSALVLDSFSGSGTTGHAVLESNKRDAGSRRFILIEMEDYADQLTAERLRRVITGFDFKGTLRSELMRETINWSRLQKGQKLLNAVALIENLHAHEYDRVKKEVKDGDLIVTGEKTILERAEGLGGSFTYCTLGAPLELDSLLRGETLPPYAGIGAVLFNMATNNAFDPAGMREADFYLGQTEGLHIWLFYKPDLDWLKSPEAALTLTRAKAISETDPEKRHLVFAPARFVSQKMLTEQKIQVEFVPLPDALYRIDRS